MKPASLAILACALTLGACDVERRTVPTASVPDGAQPAEPSGRQGAARAAPAPLPPTPRPKPGEPRLTGDRLVGLTTAETWELLAGPTTTEKEPPATVWTYTHVGCRLELFFYFDLESEQQRTLTFDLDPGSDATGARAFCLRALAARGRRLNARGAADGPPDALQGPDGAARAAAPAGSTDADDRETAE